MEFLSNNNKIGFGTWQLGGETTHGGRITGWGHTDENEAVRAIHYGLEHGIRFFDTADSYGKGHSEKILGKALKGKDIVICTKFGNLEDENGKAIFDVSPRYLVQAVEASLKRLQREAIDVLLLHSPPDDFNWAEYDPAPFEKLKAAGKIRAYGVSSKSIAGAVRVIQYGFGNVIEAIYNALDRRADERVLPLCQEKGYSFIARIPLASGFLAKKYLENGNTEFSANDIRSQLPADVVKWFVQSTRRLSFLEELEGGMAVSAMRFCISHSQVTVAIPGIRKVRHAQDAVLANKYGQLPSDVLTNIAEAVPTTYPGWL